MSIESDITTRIGHILLGILPDGAESITAEAEADVGFASTEFILHDKGGSSYPFADDQNYPEMAARAVNEAIIELRQAMTAGGQGPWFTARFTVQRDGKIDVDFSYEAPEAV